MKFILTESKLEQIVFKYLDKQDFIKIEKRNYIYFVNSKDDEYAQISINKNFGFCYVSPELTVNIEAIFSMKRRDSLNIIGKWVERALQVEIEDILTSSTSTPSSLSVERTPQIKIDDVSIGVDRVNY